MSSLVTHGDSKLLFGAVGLPAITEARILDGLPLDAKRVRYRTSKEDFVKAFGRTEAGIRLFYVEARDGGVALVYEQRANGNARNPHSKRLLG